LFCRIDIGKEENKTRPQVFHELVQTEANYTAILRTILDVFKKSLEDPNLIGGQLLNQTEIRIIFGNLPPIYEIHSKMLAEFYQVRINHHVVVSRADIFKENLTRHYLGFVQGCCSTIKKMCEQVMPSSSIFADDFFAFLTSLYKYPN
jgi:hypothetical protein